MLLTEFFMKGTALMFWFLAFCFMAVITFTCLVIRIYICRQAEKEWSKAVVRGKARRHNEAD